MLNGDSSAPGSTLPAAKHTLKPPAVPAATLISFILLCTNVNLCQHPSLPPPVPSSASLLTFSMSPHPPFSLTLYTSLYFLPCRRAIHPSTPAFFSTFPSVFHSAFCNSLYPGPLLTPPSPSYLPACVLHKYFTFFSYVPFFSILFCFTAYFSLSARAPSSDIITSTVTMVSWERATITV